VRLRSARTHASRVHTRVNALDVIQPLGFARVRTRHAGLRALRLADLLGVHHGYGRYVDDLIYFRAALQDVYGL
jgi:hypothetical protein